MPHIAWRKQWTLDNLSDFDNVAILLELEVKRVSHAFMCINNSPCHSGEYRQRCPGGCVARQESEAAVGRYVGVLVHWWRLEQSRTLGPNGFSPKSCYVDEGVKKPISWRIFGILTKVLALRIERKRASAVNIGSLVGDAAFAPTDSGRVIPAINLQSSCVAPVEDAEFRLMDPTAGAEPADIRVAASDGQYSLPTSFYR